VAISLNKACLLGNLGKSPEIRAMSNGGEVVKFSVATSESWKDKSGEWQDRTEWHNVVVFNEYLIKEAKKLSKGSKVYLEGAIQTRVWEKDSDGIARYSTEIVLQKFGGELIMMDKATGNSVSTPNPGSKYKAPVEDMDDDIPF